MDATVSEQYKKQLGLRFQPQGAEVAITLIKVEINPIGFTLLFQGPARPILAEGTYEFAVEDGTAHTFHAMPIHTPVPGHQDYQAVFN